MMEYVLKVVLVKEKVMYSFADQIQNIFTMRTRIHLVIHIYLICFLFYSRLQNALI